MIAGKFWIFFSSSADKVDLFPTVTTIATTTVKKDVFPTVTPRPDDDSYPEITTSPNDPYPDDFPTLGTNTPATTTTEKATTTTTTTTTYYRPTTTMQAKVPKIPIEIDDGLESTTTTATTTTTTAAPPIVCMPWMPGCR
jgi:hypothetical protein